METVQTTAKMIAENGIMVVLCSLAIVGAAIIFIHLINNMKHDREDFKKLYSDMTSYFTKKVDELTAATNRQNDLLNDISEGLRPETKDRLKSVIGTYFELAVEKVFRMYKRLKKENHIHEKPKETREKVLRLISNLHRNRNSQFTNFSWRGQKIHKSANPDWIEMVTEVVYTELYDEVENEERTYSNIKNIYNTVENDYLERLGLE